MKLPHVIKRSGAIQATGVSGVLSSESLVLNPLTGYVSSVPRKSQEVPHNCRNRLLSLHLS
jgi:hypothetical protein